MAGVVVVLALAGCGGGEGGFSGPTGTVSGKVTFNGTPIAEGSTVTFISQEGYAAAGTIAADSSYKLIYNGSEKIPAGTYKVQFSPPPAAATDQLVDPSKPLPEAPVEPFPSKYAASSTSGLEFIVKEGENPPIDIDLK
ncbi:MAG: hypothetical protein ABI614_00530 [Planctomycetota bacterium]